MSLFDLFALMVAICVLLYWITDHNIEVHNKRKACLHRQAIIVYPQWNGMGYKFQCNECGFQKCITRQEAKEWEQTLEARKRINSK